MDKRSAGVHSELVVGEMGSPHLGMVVLGLLR